MKNIIKSTLLLACGVCLLASCEKDDDSNPVLKDPTAFVLNTPAAATNTTYDLANSKTLDLTCSQPDYGFPASTAYYVQVATKSDMSDAVELTTPSTSAKISADAAEIASDLTTLELNAGKTEADFPMTIPVYVRLRAIMKTYNSSDVAGTEILSNTVKLNNVKLLFSLPPVTTPTNIYIVGQFCGWDWGNSLSMVPVYGSPNVFWHMVYIDDSGIKINTATAWDGNQKGYADLNSVGGTLASDIVASKDGNISSSKPGWYQMIVTTSVSGRKILYDVKFNKPEVYLIGKVNDIGWNEGVEAGKFTVPTTADGDFVSPELTTKLPGDDTDDCVRIYVPVDDGNWWHSEFIPVDGKISYRGAGGDQARYGCNIGDHVYLNFTKETGSIEKK